MRIISGQHKGRRLTAPKKLPVRPTTDIAKEGLFNILSNRFYFPEISILELFAGTGNVSFEFASRGAKNITAVDLDNGCVNYISKTSTELDLDIQVVKSNAFRYLEKNLEKHDIVFGDPPYNFEKEELERIAKLVFEKEMLKPDGVLIIEHSHRMDLSELAQFTSARKYGGTVFSFFEPYFDVPIDEK